MLLLLLFFFLPTVLAFPQHKRHPKWFKQGNLGHGFDDNLVDNMMEDMKRQAEDLLKPRGLPQGGGDFLPGLKDLEPITFPTHSTPDIDIIKNSLPSTHKGEQQEIPRPAEPEEPGKDSEDSRPDIDIIKQSIPTTHKGKPQQTSKPKPDEVRKDGWDSRSDVDIIQESVQHPPKATSSKQTHTAAQKKPPGGAEGNRGDEKKKPQPTSSSLGESGKKEASRIDELPSKKSARRDPSKIPPPKNSNGLTERDLVKAVHSRAAGLHDVIPTNGLTAVDLEGAGQGTWLTNKGLFEGDIDLGEHTIEDYTKPSAGAREGVAYNARRAITYKWPWAFVPYALQWDDSTEMNKDRRWLLAHALREIESKTCVRFTPRTTEIDYIYIGNIDGSCHSRVGREGGRQEISLTDACLFVQGTIIHEFMHALGFWHEQSRADRDDYVHINYDNVEPGRTNNFEKYDLDSITHLGAPYDYGSLMHYSYHAFSKYEQQTSLDVFPLIRNGEPTIVPYPIQDQPIGQRAAMSDIDIKKINTYYNCDGYDRFENPDMETTTTTTPSYEPRTVPYFWDEAPKTKDAGEEATDEKQMSVGEKPIEKEEEKKPLKDDEDIVVKHNGGSKNVCFMTSYDVFILVLLATL